MSAYTRDFDKKIQIVTIINYLKKTVNVFFCR